MNIVPENELLESPYLAPWLPIGDEEIKSHILPEISCGVAVTSTERFDSSTYIFFACQPSQCACQ